jgi:DNA-binding NtrC family response regulator
MILFVDDDEILQEVVTGILKIRGYEVIALESGNSAIEWLSNGNRCNLIITDIHMADGTGIDLVLWKEQQQQIDVPVIIVSGDELASLHEIEQFCEIMHLPILSKPFKAEVLLGAVKEYYKS